MFYNNKNSTKDNRAIIDEPEHNSDGIPKDIFDKWMKLAKSQSLVLELLQLELDTLSETIESGTYSITSNFQELTRFIQNTNLSDEEKASVQNNLGKVIKGLQYQDLTSQQIENISNTLKTLGKTFEFLMQETLEFDKTGGHKLLPDEEYLNQIISERTLGEMRDRMLCNLEKISEVDAEFFAAKKMDQKKDSPRKKQETQGDDDLNIELF